MRWLSAGTQEKNRLIICSYRASVVGLLTAALMWGASATAEFTGDDTLPDGRKPYGTSDEDTIRMLYDFEAGCLTDLAQGNDISQALDVMASVARRSEIAARNYTSIMEGLLPQIPDVDLQQKHTMRLAGIYNFMNEYDRADELMENVILQNPDPLTELGYTSRYTQAVREMQRGELDAATQRLEELWSWADKLEPTSFQTLGAQLAVAYARSERWEDVLRVGLPTLPMGISPGDASLHKFQTIADAYLKLGDYEKAELYFQRIVDFLTTLEAHDPNNQLLMEPFPRLATRGLHHAQVGLQTKDYQRQHVQKELEDSTLKNKLGEMSKNVVSVLDQSDSRNTGDEDSVASTKIAGLSKAAEVAIAEVSQDSKETRWANSRAVMGAPLLGVFAIVVLCVACFLLYRSRLGSTQE